MAFFFQATGQTTTLPAQYKLTLDPDGTYKVWLKSLNTYTGTNARIGTAQVSLVVPTGVGASQFTVSNLTGNNGMTWTTSSQTRLNNPSVSGTPTNKDYIVFGFTQPGNVLFDITANTEILLFSFKNSNTCSGPVALWDSTDPLQVPNTDNFNVGNQITIFGAGFGNKWHSNYGTSPIPCNTPTAPDLQVAVTPPATITQNTPAVFSVNVSNVGTGPTTGTTTVTTPIPVGMSYLSSAGTGWTCSQVATNVVCTNPNPIAAATSSPFTMTFNPTQTGATSIASTVSGGGDATPSTSPTQNLTINPASTGCLIEYKITTEADGSYKVWMKSNTTFTGTAATIGTAQVTVVFPFPLGGATPVISNLTGLNSMTWTTGTTQQVQQGSFYYVVFNFNQSTSPTVFNITAGVEIPLFTFKNTATCNGPVSLWATTDAFQVPNAINFNVGNQISVSGAGAGNKWCGNYGSAAVCPVVASPNVTVSTTAPTTTTVGTPFTVNVNVNNTGTGATTTPISVSTPIPSCMTYTSSTGTGWTCNVQGTNVVCNNPNPIPVSGSAPLALTFTPIQTCTVSITTTTTGGGLPNPLNSSTQPITVNLAAGVPAFTISMTAPATGTVNVPYNYSVNLTNTGTGPTTGATTVTIPLPNGVSYSSASGAVWSCSAQGTFVVCNNPNPINNGSSSPFSITVNPTVTGTISTFAYTSGGGAGTAFSTLVNTVISPVVTNQPNVVVSSVSNPPTGTTGIPFVQNIILSNIGNAPATGPLTYTSTLPTGVNFASVNSGWTCSQVAQQLTCTNPIALANGSSVPLNIQYNTTQPVSFTPQGTVSGNGVSNGSVTGTPMVITNGTSGCNATDCGIGVRYGIRLGNDGLTYTVYMKSATAFTGGAARIGTAQVTLKVPHGLGTSRFVPVNIGGVSATGNMQWTTNSSSRVDGPSIDPTNDYIFFGFNQATSPTLFDIQANVEYPLFTFQNLNSCNGTVGLWETTDPFQSGFQNLNPGNQITILGNGTANAWKCNYTCALPCVLPADLTVSATQPSPALSVGQTSNINVTVTNLSNTATGTITLTTTLPTGVSTPTSSFTASGWSCTRSGQTVTCTNPNTSGLAANATLSLVIPVVPSAANAGQILTFGFNVSSTGSDANTSNNSTSLITTSAVTAPNISINIPTFTLYAGQSSNVTVNVVNNGTIAINGQLTATVTLPNGATAPASFTSSGWSCATVGQTITCTNPNSSGLASNAVLPIIVPVTTPSNAVSGQTVTIVANINTVSGESNLSDNTTSGQGQLISLPNIRLVKFASAITYQSNPFDFTFTVVNTGGTNSTGTITVTDTLRSGLKYVSSTGAGWTCNKIGVDAQNNDIVQCTSSNTLIANAANSSTFTLRVNPTLSGTATNIAYVSGGGMSATTPQPSSPCSNCVAGPTAVFIQAASDLSVTILQPNPVLVVGQTSVLTVNVINSGGIAINTPLSVTVSLPVGISIPASFTSGMWSCTTTGQTLTCTNPNSAGLAPGGQTSVNINISPMLNLVGSTPTINVNVVAIVGEINTSNNSGTLTVLVPVTQPAIPDLAISISQPATSLLVGQVSNMTITVTNLGLGSATGPLTVTMGVPNGLTIPSGTSNGWTITVNNGILTATHPNSAGLATNASLSFVIGVTPASSIVNTAPMFVAVVNLAPNEINGLNNIASLTSNFGVTPINAPNLSIYLISSGVFVANQATNLNLVVINNSSVSIVGALTVNVTLPTGFSAPSSFTSGSWTGTTVGQTITLVNNNTGGLAAGAVSPIILQVTPAITMVNVVPATFTFNVVPILNESVLIDNVYYFAPSFAVLGSAGANITINIPQPIPSLTVGQASLFTINFINNGTQIQTGTLTTTIQLPAGVTAPSTFASNGWSCTTAGQTVTCTNPNTGGLPSGSTLNVIVPITPNNTLSGIVPPPIYININNSTTPFIYNFTNIVSGIGAPNLLVNVTPFTIPLVAGQTYYLPVSIMNVGPLSANSSLTINVTLPSGATAPATFTQGGWTCTTSGQLMTCTNPNTGGLPTNGIQNLLVPITIGNILVGTTPSITINVSPVVGEIITINNTFVYVIQPAIVAAPAPDLVVTISAPSPAFMANQVSNIVVNVQNIGNVIANGQLSVSFTLPANFSTASSTFTTNGWTCTTTGQNVTCTHPNISGLAVGANSSLVIGIRPNNTAIGSTFSITVNAAIVIGETNNTNNSFTLNVLTPVIVDPNTIPNLSLVESYNQSLTYYQNTPFNFSFLLINTSSLTATNGTITVTDTLRFGLKYVSGSGLGWTINKIGVDAQGNDIVQAVFTGVLPSNASTVFNITVNPTMTGVIYNQSFVSGGGMTVTLRGSAPCIGCSISPTGPIIINQALNFNVAVKALLQGPYVPSAGLMHDSLRVKNLIPLSNPYSTTAGFAQVGSGSETTTPSILAVSGSNAIVDWVLVELRSASNPSQIVATRAGLIQRDGDVVSPTDGTSALQFTGVATGNYFVAIRHRNHLGAMSASPVTVGSTTATVDLTNAAQPAYKLSGLTRSEYPQFVSGNKAMLWAGNAVMNNQIIFQGPNNDVDMIFFTIISNPLNTQAISNFIHRGYDLSDVNMDGKTVFQGPDNEVDIIFFNVLMHPENPGFLANFIVWQQIP